MQNDIIQLPLHMLDEDFDEEEEFAQYSRRARLENDVESLSKVRQVCMFCSLVFSLRQLNQCNHAIIIVIIQFLCSLSVNEIMYNAHSIYFIRALVKNEKKTQSNTPHHIVFNCNIKIITIFISSTCYCFFHFFF